ncbi:HesA/MoeB/ThiF family protein [Echinicola marina]|uniref:HesA/MoeB/ThiF family protein n=1 Tax=Echinicola marina TaxID=2859768 RepID=UPI001CF6CB5C|nr:HesA/MoeB/ThiF family protein [Echinicola marina]UCS95250.1 HesA/MoeB/ThiF family protein [Echinicola marina]
MPSSRYQKHIKLKGFGKEAQDKLAKSKVLIIGAGGLGTPAAQYLNGVGVGTIGIVDQDLIEESNLARQTLFRPKDIGKAKTDTLISWLQEQNPETKLINIAKYIDPGNALDTIADYDVVLDASDNFGTRYLVNDACVILGRPFIYGAIHDFEGQVSVLNYQDGPTYRCLFPESSHNQLIPNCDENGVLGILPGLIGTYQALEAIKVITGIGEPLSGKLMIVDTLGQNHLKIGVPCKAENKAINKLKNDYRQDVCASSMDYHELSPEDLLEKINAGTSFRLIDVRSNAEFDQDRLVQAINIPLQEINKKTEELRSVKELIIICQSGKRSQQAALMLKELFPTANIFNVQGGMNAVRSSKVEVGGVK